MTNRLGERAKAEETERYRKRFPAAAPGHFRQTLGATLGSVGMGTYLGNPDAETDEAYTRSVVEAVERGCNVIDSAANYRFQRSERSIGAGLRRLAAMGFTRDEICICTKGGYIPFDGDVPNEPRVYFTETFIKPEIATPQDLVGGMHCMTPKYLAHQLDRIRQNLGVDTIDVYYIHNPEAQLEEVSRDDFYARVRPAFECLERAASDGKIQWYGCATWNAFRSQPESRDHIELEKLVQIARDIAGESHRFKVIQLPYNIAMTEALLAKTQKLGASRVSTFEAAEELGMTVFTSVPIAQGRLIRRLPAEWHKYFSGLATDAQRAIQFVRSSPTVTAALVGMSTREHVQENPDLSRRIQSSKSAPTISFC